MEFDWRGLAANQYQQCSGSTLQQRKDFCNRLTPSASQAALNTREIAAGVTSLVARLDSQNKGVYTRKMEPERSRLRRLSPMRLHRRAPPEPGSDSRVRKGDARVGHSRHPVHAIGDADSNRPYSDHAPCGPPRPRADNPDPQSASARSGWVCSNRRGRRPTRPQGGDHAGRRRDRATSLPLLEEGAGRGFGGATRPAPALKISTISVYTLKGESVMFEILRRSD